MLPFYLFVGILLAIILFLFVIGLSLPGRLPFVIEGKHAVITGFFSLYVFYVRFSANILRKTW